MSTSARRAVGADQLHEELGAGELHRVPDWDPRHPESAERFELRRRPLLGDQRPPESGAVGHRPGLAALADSATLQVAGIAVEQAVVAIAVALGGQQ